MHRGTFCLLAVALSASAHAAAKVDCSKGQTISAAIAALKPAAGYQVIDVTGACTDNLYVAPNQAIAINGAKGASLAPANASYAAVNVEGRLTIYNFAITTGNFAAVFVNQGGYAQMTALSVTGPGDGLQVSDHSGALVQNSSFNVTGFAAVNIYAGGDVEIDGIAVKGQTGPSFTGGTDGIFCPTGSVTLNASGAPITLSGSGHNGLEMTGCIAHTIVSNGGTITFSGNGAAVAPYGSGVSVGRGAAVELFNVAIINNVGFGVDAYEGGEATITGATITGNTNTALQASQNGLIHLANFDGINTITEPAGNSNPLFSCYQGGKNYVDQIAGTIQPSPTQTNQGCLTIGGP